MILVEENEGNKNIKANSFGKAPLPLSAILFWSFIGQEETHIVGDPSPPRGLSRVLGEGPAQHISFSELFPQVRYFVLVLLDGPELFLELVQIILSPLLYHHLFNQPFPLGQSRFLSSYPLHDLFGGLVHTVLDQLQILLHPFLVLHNSLPGLESFVGLLAPHHILDYLLLHLLLLGLFELLFLDELLPGLALFQDSLGEHFALLDFVEFHALILGHDGKFLVLIGDYFQLVDPLHHFL